MRGTRFGNLARQRIWLGAALAAAMLFAFSAWSAPGGDLNDFLARIQSNDGATRRAAWESAGPYGAQAVAPLVKILAADTGNDKAKKDQAKAAGFALERIAHHAARPGAEAERRAVAAELIKAVNDDANARAYDPLLNLIAATAEDDSVPAVAALLLDPNPRRREMARWALLRIATPGATKALIEALDKVDLKFRPAVTIALGEKRSPEAVAPLLRLAESNDEPTRVEALCALGKIGDPRAAAVFKRALASASDTTRSRIADAYLRLADSLAAKDSAAALDIYKNVLAGTPDAHSRSAALIGLGKAGGVEIVPLVLPAMSDESNQVRAGAMECLVGLKGDAASRALMDAYKTARPDSRAALLRVLSARQPASLDDFLKAAAKDENAEVKVTACELLGKLDDPALEPALLEAAERGSPQIKPVALRAYVKLAEGRLARNEKAEALAIYHRALDLNPPDDATRLALEGLRRIASPESLSRIEALFDRPALAVDAQRVSLAIAASLGKAGDKDRAIKMLQELIDGTRAPDVVQGAINELRNLGVDTSSYAAKMGLITKWHVIGPYPVDEQNPWNKSWGPEKEVKLDQEEKIGDRTLRWKETTTTDPQGKVNLVPLFTPNENVLCYAFTELNAPVERDINIRIGSDDGAVVWLNGKQVYAKNEPRSWAADQDTITKVHLKKGPNALLVKIINGATDWAFGVRLCNTQNRPLDLTRFQ